jgi:hypothetical protein
MKCRVLTATAMTTVRSALAVSLLLMVDAAQAGIMFTMGTVLEPSAVLELDTGAALNAPTHQPGDRIRVSEATSPVVGPVGGVTRVGDLTVEIEAGAKVTGGAAPGWNSWSGTVTDTIGVRTGAGSSLFNRGTIQAGSTAPALGASAGAGQPPANRALHRHARPAGARTRSAGVRRRREPGGGPGCGDGCGKQDRRRRDRDPRSAHRPAAALGPGRRHAP